MPVFDPERRWWNHVRYWGAASLGDHCRVDSWLTCERAKTLAEQAFNDEVCPRLEVRQTVPPE